MDWRHCPGRSSVSTSNCHFCQDAIEDIKDDARSRVVNAYDSRRSDINNLKAELDMDAKRTASGGDGMHRR